MNEIVIKIAQSGADATKNALLQVQRVADTLNGRTVKINVDASGLTQATGAAAKYYNALARSREAESAFALQVEKTKQAQEKRLAAEARLAAQMEKTATAEEQARKANINLSTQVERTATAQTQLATQAERTRTAETNLQAQQERTTRAMIDSEKAAGGAYDALARFAQLYVINRAFQAFVSSIREAAATLRSVDTQLVEVQKTTGYSGAEIDALTDKVYDLAAAYGRTADELLGATANFARAGFSDLEQMTELSALLQNIGDLTDEEASTFLVASNAAWQLHGSYDALMEIIDGLNAQTNNAAVAMPQLTSAIQVAGSVFAHSGESVQMFAALIGAAEAATQRGGAEVGRALRTISMRLRQVRGELDDGEIIDAEAISNAAKALESVGIAIADQQGNLRLTSDLLDELAGKWESLDGWQQSYLSQQIAGQRQANILTALLQNWGEVERQAQLYAEGAGSALRENEIYLQSWTAKQKVLTAAWTEFISGIVDTDAVKAALDGLIGIVNALNTDFGQAAATGLSFAGTVSIIGAAVKALQATMAGAEFLSALFNPWVLAAGAVAAAIALIVKSVNDYKQSLRETYPELYTLKDALDAAGEAVTQAQEKYEASEKTTRATAEIAEKYLDILERLETAGLDTAEAQNQYAAAVGSLNSLLPELNLQIDEQTGKLTQNTSEIRENVAAWRELAIQKALQSKYDDVINEQMQLEISKKRAEIELQGLRNRLEVEYGITGELETQKRLLEERADAETVAPNGNVKPLVDALNAIAEYEDAISAADEALAEISAKVNELGEITASLTKATEGSAAALTTHTAAVATAQDAADKLAKSASATTAALKDFSEYGALTSDAMNGLTEAMGDSLDALFDETGALTKAGQAAFETASEFTSAKDAVEYLQTAAQAANYANLIAQIQAAGTAAVISTQQIAAMLQAVGLSASIADAQARGMALTAKYNGTSAQSELLGYLNAQTAALKQQTEEISRSAAKSGSTGSGSSRGSGGGSSEKEKDEELEALKTAVSLEKQRLSFLEASGAADDERIAKMQDIQTALHAQAEYLRSIGASEEEIKALSTEWWTIQNKIKGVYDEQAKTAEKLAEEQKKAREEAEKAREDAEKAAKQAFYDYADAQKKALEAARDAAALKPLQEQLDALNAQRSAVEEQRKEQERLLAVEQARAALENAQKQRNVRQFNADTQQWEWVADSREIEDAKKAVIDAEKALADYHSERLYQAQKKAIEDQIAATKEAFEAQRDAWTEAAELVRSGALSVEEAMAYAAQAVQSAASQIQSAASWAATSASAGSGASGGVSASSGGFFSGSTGYGGNYTRPDMSRNEALAGKTVYTDGFNVTYDENGYATKAVNPDHSNYEGTTMSAHAQSKEDALAGKDFTPDYSGLYDWNNGSPDYSKKYDSGGVLHGMGGIKETTRDEAVLNPDHTERFLAPQADDRLERVADQTERLMDLGEEPFSSELFARSIAATMAGSMGALSVGGREILTAARPAANGFPMPQPSTSSIGTQNNGDTYHVYVDKIPIPNVNQGTTLGEIAQAAKLTLPIHRG